MLSNKIQKKFQNYIDIIGILVYNFLVRKEDIQ